MFIIPLLATAIMFYLYQKQNKGEFGPVSFIFLLYILMGVSAVVLYFFYDYSESFRLELQPMLLLSVCICIVFYGVFSYSDNRIRFIYVENIKLVRWLELFQIVGSIIATVFFVPFAVTGLAGDIAQGRFDLLINGSPMAVYGLLNSVCSLVGNLFFISIFLAFLNFASIGQGGSRLRGQILLLASSVNIVYVLAYVGRDGLIYWTFSYIFIYMMMKNFIPKSEMRAIKKVVFALIFLALIPFIYITFARFSEDYVTTYAGSGNSTLLSLFDYAGQQIYNFNDQYLVDAKPEMGKVNFYLFLEIIHNIFGSKYEALDKFEWYEIYTSVGAVPWNFSTFIGSWIQDFGGFGTVIAILLLAFLTRLTLRKLSDRGELSFTNMLYFLLLSQIPLFGVFYYRQFCSVYAQIAVVLMALFLNIFKGKKYAVRIKRLEDAH